MEVEYASVIDRAIDKYVIPAYEHVELTTADLVAEVEGYCVAPGAETKAALAESFAETIDAWAGVDFFRFGPMARDGRYERFAFFPDVHGTGARQLRRFLATEDETLLRAGALAEQSAAIQGLPALESLLYSGSNALSNTDTPAPYRCALATAVAANMDLIAREADSSGVAGYGVKSFLASNGEGLIVEAGADTASRAVEQPGVAFDSHLRVLGA